MKEARGKGGTEAAARPLVQVCNVTCPRTPILLLYRSLPHIGYIHEYQVEQKL